MALLRFRIVLEDYDDIQYDIEIMATQPFQILFESILKGIQFDQIQEGRFFLADYNWRKGKNIASFNTGDDLNTNVQIVDFIDDPHQKFLFEYDANVGWNFMVELIKVTKPDANTEYPKLLGLAGVPPVQYKETLIIPTRERTRRETTKSDDEEFLFEGLLADEDEDEAPTAVVEEESEPAAEEIAEIELEDLETDNEIAEMGSAIIETNGPDDTDEYGDYQDDDYGSDEFGDDDEYGSGSRGSYGYSDEDY
jgi:hypothetical protein